MFIKNYVAQNHKNQNIKTSETQWRIKHTDFQGHQG